MGAPVVHPHRHVKVADHSTTPRSRGRAGSRSAAHAVAAEEGKKKKERGLCDGWRGGADHERAGRRCRGLIGGCRFGRL